jgi:glutaredoxin 3
MLSHCMILQCSQDYLGKITPGRSVPRVFIGGTFIGGGDDTAAQHANGQLKTKLEAAGAIPK